VIAYGYAAGLGLDVAITSNLFARAEWEFTQFLGINNTRMNMNSGQVGLGVRF
jgi:opacity protein-like surface antigen